jgi:hypothetical protein
VTPRFAFGVSPAMDIGTLPRVSAGALVTASLQLGRARLGVLGSAWIPQDAEFDAATHAGASFDMFTFGAWGSFMIPMRAFAFGPTVGVEDTHVRVEGFGIRAPEASWARWSTVVLGARAEARLIRWLLLTLRADVTVPIDPPTFTLGRSSTAEQLHDPADFGVRLSLGPEIVLP